MTAFDILLEAIEYANEEDTLWWECLESKSEAKQIFKEVSRTELDEYEVIALADALEQDYPLDSSNINTVMKQCLKTLKQQL